MGHSSFTSIGSDDLSDAPPVTYRRRVTDASPRLVFTQDIVAVFISVASIRAELIIRLAPRLPAGGLLPAATGPHRLDRLLTNLSGATAVVGGERLNYTCGDHLSVYGPPERSQAVWTVRAGRDASSELTTSSVEPAWF